MLLENEIEISAHAGHTACCARGGAGTKLIGISSPGRSTQQRRGFRIRGVHKQERIVVRSKRHGIAADDNFVVRIELEDCVAVGRNGRRDRAGLRMGIPADLEAGSRGLDVNSEIVFSAWLAGDRIDLAGHEKKIRSGC